MAVAMLTIVCFKWTRNKTGFQLPAVVRYGAEHVNVLQSMVARHYQKKHRFVCVTDDATGLNCETLPMWQDHRELGGCYSRLKIFSAEVAELFGPRFICIDLDCVILGDLTSIFEDRSYFIINTYNAHSEWPRDQKYNGSLIMMDAGAREQVWKRFDPKTSPAALAESRRTVGTDQAWIRHCLGPLENRFTNEMGVYEVRQIGPQGPPRNAKMIFFSGARDPSLSQEKWIRDNWK